VVANIFFSTFPFFLCLFWLLGPSLFLGAAVLVKELLMVEYKVTHAGKPVTQRRNSPSAAHCASCVFIYFLVYSFPPFL
jgi:hypothetical protein